MRLILGPRKGQCSLIHGQLGQICQSDAERDKALDILRMSQERGPWMS